MLPSDLKGSIMPQANRKTNANVQVDRRLRQLTVGGTMNPVAGVDGTLKVGPPSWLQQTAF
jgi:hypothetical protein